MKPKVLIPLLVAIVLAVVVLLRFLGPPRMPPDPPAVITVVCMPNGEDPRVNVAPDPYERRITQNSRWVLNTNRPNDNTIAIEPKPGQPWPFEGTSYGSDQNGQVDVPPDEFVDDLEEGTYYYQVAYTCDGQPYVLDPRMELHR